PVFHCSANHHPVSYADVAASGPKQSPEEAAAPQPPQVITDESASTASLIDVDLPSVHTVPADFLEQEIQTETQAARLEREEEAAAAAAASKKAKARKQVKSADSWLQAQFARLSDNEAGAVAAVNLATVVGISAFLGYKAWGLYQRGSLSWKDIGIGAGVVASVGAVESVVGRYLYKTKKDGSS
ncbi:unnamed protein product, partial [Clonostachys rhizophaga]